MTYTTNTVGVATTRSTTPVGNREDLGSLDNFLKLFLTQMQYQDPLDPVKDHQFIAQLAQFSQLEESQAINRQLGMLGYLLESNQGLQGLAFLGKEVVVETGDGKFTGLVTGVSFAKGRPQLLVAGHRIELSQVTAVTIVQPPEEGDGDV